MPHRQIKNRQISKCRRFVIHQITQTQTETETEAVRSQASEVIISVTNQDSNSES